MPGDDVIPAAVQEYLATVATGLIGPRRWRSQVVDELRDGLVEATQAHRASAGSVDAAAAAAVAEFGAPELVMSGLVPVGAGRLARHVVVGLLASGPVAASVWVAAMAGSGMPPWHGGLAGPWRLLPWVGAVLGTVVAAAVLVLLVTGRPGYRWGIVRPALAPAAAGVASVGCGVGDLVMLAAVGMWTLSAPVPAGGPALAVAVGFSAVRCLLAGCAFRCCQSARSRLG